MKMIFYFCFPSLIFLHSYSVSSLTYLYLIVIILNCLFCCLNSFEDVTPRFLNCCFIYACEISRACIFHDVRLVLCSHCLVIKVLISSNLLHLASINYFMIFFSIPIPNYSSIAHFISLLLITGFSYALSPSAFAQFP